MHCRLLLRGRLRGHGAPAGRQRRGLRVCRARRAAAALCGSAAAPVVRGVTAGVRAALEIGNFVAGGERRGPQRRGGCRHPQGTERRWLLTADRARATPLRAAAQQPSGPAAQSLRQSPMKCGTRAHLPPLRPPVARWQVTTPLFWMALHSIGWGCLCASSPQLRRATVPCSVLRIKASCREARRDELQLFSSDSSVHSSVHNNSGFASKELRCHSAARAHVAQLLQNNYLYMTSANSSKFSRPSPSTSAA